MRRNQFICIFAMVSRAANCEDERRGETNLVHLAIFFRVLHYSSPRFIFLPSIIQNLCRTMAATRVGRLRAPCKP